MMRECSEAEVWELYKDDNNFIELCKTMYLQQIKTMKDVDSFTYTNPATGNSFTLKLINKTLKRFLIVKK
ncbi:hypothetical protein [Turicibacter sanguinis]|uniref:hypothetical protein n=1 Tax=Turicibacter sanguinis TaxID=154288 RepID=UPI00325B55CE